MHGQNVRPQVPSYSRDQEQTVLPDPVLPLKPTPPSLPFYRTLEDSPQPPVPHNYLEHRLWIQLERNHQSQPRMSKSENLGESDEMGSDSNDRFYHSAPPGISEQLPPLLGETKRESPTWLGVQYPPTLRDYLPPTLFDTIVKPLTPHSGQYLLPPALGSYLPPKLTDSKERRTTDLTFSPPKLGRPNKNVF